MLEKKEKKKAVSRNIFFHFLFSLGVKILFRSLFITICVKQQIIKQKVEEQKIFLFVV